MYLVSSFGVLLLLCTVVIAAPPAFGDLVIVNANFGAVPIGCFSTGSFRQYAYQGTDGCGNQAQDFNSSPGFGWTLGISYPQTRGSGLTSSDTAFNPPPFDGMPFTQAVFLQDQNSSVSQAIAGFMPGSYTLSFYLGSRFRNDQYDGNQTVEALMDGNAIGTWALQSFTPFTLETASFKIDTAGTHTLEFEGINSGDHTAFLSDVGIVPSASTPELSTLALLVTGFLGCFARWYRR